MRLHVIQCTVLLSQFCPSIRLSACQMRALWQNKIIVHQYLNTIQNRDISSLSTPTGLLEISPFHPKYSLKVTHPRVKRINFNIFQICTEKVCYEVLSCKNFEWQSCRTVIRPLDGPKIFHRDCPIPPKIFAGIDPLPSKNADFDTFPLIIMSQP